MHLQKPLAIKKQIVQVLVKTEKGVSSKSVIYTEEAQTKAKDETNNHSAKMHSENSNNRL